jgi:hypothetical protein
MLFREARETLARELAERLVRDVSGAVLEIRHDGMLPAVVSFWENAASWPGKQPTGGFILGEDTPSNSAAAPAAFAVWLFGPERAPSPKEILRRLAGLVKVGGTVVVASESPWPGKSLAADEFGEYTAEEIAAYMVRAGVGERMRHAAGEGFAVWIGTRSGNPTFDGIAVAAHAVENGQHEVAERALESASRQLEERQAVLELILLTAACHDLAGRYHECAEALVEAVALEPRCARAMCGLGRIALLLGQTDEARAWFARALTLQPALVAGLRGMALACERTGAARESYGHLAAAALLRPGDERMACQAVDLGFSIGVPREADGVLSRMSLGQR